MLWALAVFFPLFFTAPRDTTTWGDYRDVQEYRLRQTDKVGYSTWRVLLAGPDLLSGPPRPNPYGLPDTVFFSLSTDGQIRRYELFSIDPSGNWSLASNPNFIGAGVLPDTGFIDLSRWGNVQDSWSKRLPTGEWAVWFKRESGDSSFVVDPRWYSVMPTVSAPIVSWREFQRLFAYKSCELYHEFYEGGNVWPCP